MQIGMIGPGRMGSNMVRRLMREGRQSVVYNRHAEAVKALHSQGVVGTVAFEEFIASMTQSPIVWLMVPAMVVEEVLAQLTPLHEVGASYANRFLSAMRKQFGGYDEKKDER
ncbi:MAG: NAD(P)-binding domain-containing protein [Sulfuriferula sp.]